MEKNQDPELCLNQIAKCLKVGDLEDHRTWKKTWKDEKSSPEWQISFIF